MTANVGTTERIIRVIVGLALLLLPFVSSWDLFDGIVATVISVVFGLVLLGTAAIRFCPLTKMMGIDTTGQ